MKSSFKLGDFTWIKTIKPSFTSEFVGEPLNHFEPPQLLPQCHIPWSPWCCDQGGLEDVSSKLLQSKADLERCGSE